MPEQEMDQRVLGTFDDAETARRAAHDLENTVPGDRVVVGGGEEAAMARQAEMEEEARKGLWAPGAFGTQSQTRGWVTGLAVGGVLGAAIGALVGLLVAALSDLSTVAAVVIVAVCGAFAGGTAGFQIGGSVGPKVAGEVDEQERDVPLAAERGVTVGVEVHDEEESDVAKDILEQSAAERVDRPADLD